MIFSKPKKETLEFTVEKCFKCNKKVKRPYKQDDVLFTDTNKCNSCEGKFQVEMIYGEIIEK